MERQTNEVERISVTSSKPFEAVVDALDRAMGHPNVAEQQISEGTGSFAVSVPSRLRPSGLAGERQIR
jgi:hypothetical protein